MKKIGIFMLVLLGLLLSTCSKTGPKSGIELSNFDKNYRPQDNFYLFVNGNWLKRVEIPADRSNYGAFTELAEINEKRIKGIIDELLKKEYPSGSDEQKIADLYRSFMDTLTIQKAGIQPLESQLKKILDVTNKKELAATIAYLRKIGVQTPFASYVRIDDKNATRYITFLNQSGLGLPDRDYYFKKEDKFVRIQREYIKYIAKILEMAGIQNADNKASKIFNLEKRLASYHWTRVQNRDVHKRYNKMNKSDLKKLAGGFNWDVYLDQAGLASEKEFIVSQPSYFQGFSKVWKKVSLSLWKDYLVYKVINEFAPFLTDDFVQARFDFYGKTLRGIKQNRPRWKRAINLVNGAIGMLVGKIYVQKYFPPEAKKRMTQLVENLRKAYAERIKNLDWMSEKTKKAALEKLQAFYPKIGYPDKWKDYTGLEIKKDDLIGNIIRISQFEYNYNINKLGKPIDRTEWHMTPQTVNAYYNPTMNEVVFPAAILQPPFFNLKADDAVNYGAIGAVIGHEMTHGFDDQGSQYDAKGNLKNWWTQKDLEEFKKRGEKLAAQYDQFSPLKGYHVNGKLTLGENIADLGGLTIAYYAYKMSLQGTKAPVLDGYTGPQRFFIGWAQVWRRKYTKEELIRRLMTDPHSPSEYRVNGVVRNMPEFYEAFDVKEGDSLYLPPEERVKIW